MSVAKGGGRTTSLYCVRKKYVRRKMRYAVKFVTSGDVLLLQG